MTLEKLYNRNTNTDLFTDEDTYERVNCGSFALDVDTWYCPYLQSNKCSKFSDEECSIYGEEEREQYVIELFEDGLEKYEVMNILIDRDFEFIMKTCPWLVPIRKADIKPTDRVIAYRLSINFDPEEESIEDFCSDPDMDFHFRLFRDGKWYEKNGAGPIHEVEMYDEDPWCFAPFLIYEGPIRYAKFR